MYHELEIRNQYYQEWTKLAISDVNFHHFMACGDDCCLVYDRDDIRLYTVRMPYEELLARLNGQEVPKKPVVVDVECWGVFSGTKLIMAFDCKQYAERFIEKMGHDHKRLAYMKGTYTSG
jgi:hypothetical protein